LKANMIQMAPAAPRAPPISAPSRELISAAPRAENVKAYCRFTQALTA
jgi:hypothetical protein